jgi:hypothetical protein
MKNKHLKNAADFILKNYSLPFSTGKRLGLFFNGPWRNPKQSIDSPTQDVMVLLKNPVSKEGELIFECFD